MGFEGERGGFKGERGEFKGERGECKGERGEFKGEAGGGFKRERGGFKGEGGGVDCAMLAPAHTHIKLCATDGPLSSAPMPLPLVLAHDSDVDMMRPAVKMKPEQNMTRTADCTVHNLVYM